VNTAQQRAKADIFRRLHQVPDLLVLCNTSDVASSRLVVEAGYPAIATSSAGVAWLLGYPDGEKISRTEMLDMVRRVADAVVVPVTADMEAGYGTRPDDVAECVRATIAAGAVGINIEDAVKTQSSLLDFTLAVDRVKAARQAADATGVPMVINARTDGFLRGGKGPECFKEAVRRANAFREAGADSLFVPGVRDAETIGALCKEIDGPVNILAAAPSPPLPELKRLGVRRVSIGGLLALAAGSLVRRAAQELKATGTYSFAKDVILHPEMNKLLG
jgi:2-methylisocitrate lyase-like PEP mutase family enzyme